MREELEYCIPPSNERVVGQALTISEREEKSILFRLLMGVSQVQARTLMLHVIRKTGPRWDTTGTG